MKAKFLEHIFEPIRTAIAVGYARHEYRKLLPAVRDVTVWEAIDADIAAWPERLKLENFWNAIHGLSMGLRLKSLVPLITSQHILWEERDVPIGELSFGGVFGPAGKLPGKLIAAKDVATALHAPEHRILLDETLTQLIQEKENTVPREGPIFAVGKQEGLRVIDGNRRLLDAIANDRSTIRAYVGKPVADPILYEYWLPTQILTEAAFWHKKNREMGIDTTDETARWIAGLIRDSSMGRNEFVTRVIHKGDKAHEALLMKVAEFLPIGDNFP